MSKLKPLYRRACSVEDCGLPHHGHGYCSKHGNNLRDFGDLHRAPIERPSSTPAERFLSKFTAGAPDECWEWQAHLDRGYGQLRVDDVPMKAYRFSYEHFIGPIPEGMHVRHKCDNPPCVNPGHLKLGTHADNMRDMAERGRAHRGKLSQDQVAAIVRELASGKTHAEIGLRFGTSRSMVGNIKRGISYKREQAA